MSKSRLITLAAAIAVASVSASALTSAFQEPLLKESDLKKLGASIRATQVIVTRELFDQRAWKPKLRGP